MPDTAPRDLARDALAGEIDAIVAGTSHDPHAVLGAHPEAGGVVVRVLRGR
jgi:1,4-alpha-glucan branching enzyme